MKLYTAPMPPNPRRVNQFLQYKGIELETIHIDMAVGEQMSAAFKAINPNCTIPALALDDGTCLSEVVGICLYLESIFPDKPLMGTPGLEQAQVVSAMHFTHLNGFTAVAEAFRNASPRHVDRALPGPLDLEQIPELAARGHKRLAYFYERQNAALNGRDFLVGDRLSQADIDLRVVCDFAAIVKQKVPEDCPSLVAHQQRISEAIPLQV